MTTFYNEIEPFAAAWLRRLIEFGELPKGIIVWGFYGAMVTPLSRRKRR